MLDRLDRVLAKQKASTSQHPSWHQTGNLSCRLHFARPRLPVENRNVMPVAVHFKNFTRISKSIDVANHYIMAIVLYRVWNMSVDCILYWINICKTQNRVRSMPSVRLRFNCIATGKIVGRNVHLSPHSLRAIHTFFRLHFLNGYNCTIIRQLSNYMVCVCVLYQFTGMICENMAFCVNRIQMRKKPSDGTLTAYSTHVKFEPFAECTI